MSRGTQVRLVREWFRARSTGLSGGAFWVGITGTVALGIAGCTHHLLNEQRPAAATAATADLGPTDAGTRPRVRMLTAQTLIVDAGFL